VGSLDGLGLQHLFSIRICVDFGNFALITVSQPDEASDSLHKVQQSKAFDRMPVCDDFELLSW
jgi:hypothetical protein